MIVTKSWRRNPDEAQLLQPWAPLCPAWARQGWPVAEGGGERPNPALSQAEPPWEEAYG